MSSRRTPALPWFAALLALGALVVLPTLHDGAAPEVRRGAAMARGEPGLPAGRSDVPTPHDRGACPVCTALSHGRVPVLPPGAAPPADVAGASRALVPFQAELPAAADPARLHPSRAPPA